MPQAYKKVINPCKIFFILLLFILQHNKVWSQETHLLHKADTLFQQEKYTEALPIYENILLSGYYNYAMLLKMAYIQEGLDNYPKALYYLNMYYMYAADRKAMVKIKALADKYELSGYEYNKIAVFLILLKKYSQIIALIAGMSSLIFILYIFIRWRRGERSVITIALLVIAIAAITCVNNLQPAKEGIVVGDNVLLRSGPSAGAEPLNTIKHGHKVKIVEHFEAWSKIIWEGEEVYIRNARLLLI